MNKKPQVKFEVIAELAEKIFVQNSAEIGKEATAESLADWSFNCAQWFFVVKQERKLQAQKELIEDLED